MGEDPSTEELADCQDRPKCDKIKEKHFFNTKGENTMEIKRQLEIGDTIRCMGITATIAEIAFQEPWEWRESYYLEFTDTNGNYRSWKQEFDGGKAYDKNMQEI
jgi:hypothetical protein